MFPVPQGDHSPPAPAPAVDGEILGVGGVGPHRIEVRAAIETGGNPRPHRRGQLGQAAGRAGERKGGSRHSNRDSPVSALPAPAPRKAVTVTQVAKTISMGYTPSRRGESGELERPDDNCGAGRVSAVSIRLARRER